MTFSVSGASRNSVFVIYVRSVVRMRFKVLGDGVKLMKSLTRSWTWSDPKIGTIVFSSVSFNSRRALTDATAADAVVGDSAVNRVGRRPLALAERNWNGVRRCTGGERKISNWWPRDGRSDGGGCCGCSASRMWWLLHGKYRSNVDRCIFDNGIGRKLRMCEGKACIRFCGRAVDRVWVDVVGCVAVVTRAVSSWMKNR